MAVERTILVVDDEPSIRLLVARALSRAGHGVIEAANAAEALRLARARRSALAILDLGLPDRDGLELIGLLAEREISVLVLTAREAVDEKVAALDLGADDYLVKPFDTEELLARLRALTRRAAGHTSSTIECGDLSIDTRGARVFIEGAPVKVTSHEFRMLSYLAHHQDRVISRTELVEHIYDQDFDRDSNTIEVFVGRLRKKIGPDRIETVRGLGYRLVDPVARPVS